MSLKGVDLASTPAEHLASTPAEHLASPASCVSDIQRWVAELQGSVTAAARQMMEDVASLRGQDHSLQAHHGRLRFIRNESIIVLIRNHLGYIELEEVLEEPDPDPHILTTLDDGGEETLMTVEESVIEANHENPPNPVLHPDDMTLAQYNRQVSGMTWWLSYLNSSDHRRSIYNSSDHSRSIHNSSDHMRSIHKNLQNLNSSDHKRSIHKNLQNLDDVSFVRILGEDTDKKIVFVEGRVKNSNDPAVIVFEKLPWRKEDFQALLSRDTSVSHQSVNDIYGKYLVSPPPGHNSVKLTLIHPATPAHMDKYSSSPAHRVEETPELYHTVVLPHIQSQQFSLQWVYNILEHRILSRIIYEDPDPETGFILAQDFKWSGETVSDLHCLAIIHKRGIKSLRDLDSSHLPLLRNIQEFCIKVMWEKYELRSEEVRMYFHYHPTYYHLHVHVTSISRRFRSHHLLLDKVIRNIEWDPCYYQKATLSFMVKERENLFGKLFDSKKRRRDWSYSPIQQKLMKMAHSEIL